MDARSPDNKEARHEYLRGQQHRRRTEVMERELEIQEEHELAAAAMVGAGTYIAIRTAQTTVDLQGSVPSMVEAFRGLLAGEASDVSEGARKFLNSDPAALAGALFAAGMVMQGLDPTDFVDAVIPFS